MCNRTFSRNEVASTEPEDTDGVPHFIYIYTHTHTYIGRFRRSFIGVLESYQKKRGSGRIIKASVPVFVSVALTTTVSHGATTNAVEANEDGANGGGDGDCEDGTGVMVVDEYSHVVYVNPNPNG